MKQIEFNDVTFTYPMVEGDLDQDGKQIVPSPVFDHFTGIIPAQGGITSLIGPNGSGKSTFLMLASGRLEPSAGTCTLFGQKTASLPEEQKNLLASVIYQNMEFESSDKVLSLLGQVYANGALKGSAAAIKTQGQDLLQESIQIFELDGVLNHSLTELSKGEIQRVLLAFSILYGSPAIFMDEPMFAMEERQKVSSLEYLREYTAKTGTSIFISMHELDLSRRFADNVILFYPNRDMDYGTPQEVMTTEALEKAYGVPAAMLKDQESMNREVLNQTAQAIIQARNNTCSQ